MLPRQFNHTDTLMIYDFVEVVLPMQLLPNFNEFSDTKNTPFFVYSTHTNAAIFIFEGVKVAVTLLHCKKYKGTKSEQFYMLYNV